MTFRKTKDEIMAEISERVQAGYPKRTLAEGIKLFRETAAGRRAFDELASAPTSKSEAIVINGTGIDALRQAAAEEARIEGPSADAIWDEIRVAARLDYLPKAEVFKARQRFLDSPKGTEMYKAYCKARNQTTVAREAYADALVDEELRPLHDQLALEEDGARYLAESIAPAIANRRTELAVLAQRGASVAELEAGHRECLDTVQKVTDTALALQARLAAAEFEPIDESFRDCVSEVLRAPENEALARALIQTLAVTSPIPPAA